MAGLQGSTDGGEQEPMSQHSQVTATAPVAVTTVHMTGVSTTAVLKVPSWALSTTWEALEWCLFSPSTFQSPGGAPAGGT